MRSLNVVKFYLTREIYKELLSTYGWAKRIVYKKQKPVHVTLSLSLLYYNGFLSRSSRQYVHTTPTPNGLDPLLSEDQVILLIQSSSIIGLPELTYLAAALHQENMQNKL